MKDIVTKIYEAQNYKTVLYFNNMAALCIFCAEEAGQISDGKYENSRPANHWMWLNGDCKVKFDKDNDNGYESNYQHRIKYNIDEWPGYIKKGGNWSWAERILSYGKTGKVMENLGVKVDMDYFKLEDAVRFMEYYKEEFGTNIKEIEEYINSEDNKLKFLKSYFEKAKSVFLDDKFIEEYNKIEYNIKELKADLMDMNETVNTYIGYKE